MPFFSIGDIVTVRSDLICNVKRYYMDNPGYHDIVNNTMARLLGKKVKITKASEKGYSVREDSYRWMDEMFEEYIHRFDSGPDAAYPTPTEDELLSFLGM